MNATTIKPVFYVFYGHATLIVICPLPTMFTFPDGETWLSPMGVNEINEQLKIDHFLEHFG